MDRMIETERSRMGLEQEQEQEQEQMMEHMIFISFSIEASEGMQAAAGTRVSYGSIIQ